jgi:hypothetical protein
MADRDAGVRDVLAEAGLSADQEPSLVELLEALADVDEEHVPEPSPGLAALMADLPVLSSRPQRRLRVLVAGGVAASMVCAGGIAAAANELPASAQRIVAEFSQRYLPFQLPQPEESEPEVPTEADPAPDTPGQVTQEPQVGTETVSPADDSDETTPTSPRRIRGTASPTPDLVPSPVTTAAPPAPGPTETPTTDLEPTPTEEATPTEEETVADPTDGEAAPSPVEEPTSTESPTDSEDREAVSGEEATPPGLAKEDGEHALGRRLGKKR